MRKKFRPRYVRGGQFITPDFSETRAIEERHDALSGAVGAGAGAISNALLPGSGALVGPAVSFLTQTIGQSKRNREITKLEEAAERKANINNANVALVSDPTETQASTFKFGTKFVEPKVYKKGSINIKPENKGKFTAFAKRKGMSVQQAASNVLANKNKYSSTIVKRANFAKNASKWKKEDGTKELKGTKDVEVEKDELLFRNVNGRWKLIADFNGEKTHEAGGVDINAQQGDVIFPGTKRKDLISMLDTNGFINKEKEPEFETERFKLPSDTNKEEFEEGTPGLKEAFESINTKSLGEKIGEGALTTGQLAPTIYNLIQGSKKPEKVQKRFVKFARPDFIDTSQDLRNDAREQFLTDRAFITGKSGGNAGALLSNIGAAGNRFQRTLSDINVNTSNRRQAHENALADVTNQETQINTQLGIGFDEADEQNRARRRTFFGEGLSQISDLSQREMFERNAERRDKRQQLMNMMALSIMGGPNFEVNAADIASTMGIELPEGMNFDNLIKRRKDIGINPKEDQEEESQNYSLPLAPYRNKFQGY